MKQINGRMIDKDWISDNKLLFLFYEMCFNVPMYIYANKQINDVLSRFSQYKDEHLFTYQKFQ